MKSSDNINNLLSGLKRDNPYTLPENYFRDFPSVLSDRIASEHSIAANKAGKKKFLNWRFYAAAAVLVIAAIIAGNAIFNKSINQVDNLHAEISIMVENELYSINDQTIIDALEPQITSGAASTSLKPDEAIDYLLNEDLSDSELLNEM